MQQKLDFIERHPFHLALESTNLDAGFVTEKVFQVTPVSPQWPVLELGPSVCVV